MVLETSGGTVEPQAETFMTEENMLLNSIDGSPPHQVEVVKVRHSLVEVFDSASTGKRKRAPGDVSATHIEHSYTQGRTLFDGNISSAVAPVGRSQKHLFGVVTTAVRTLLLT